MTDDNPTQRYDPPTAASTPAAPPPPAAFEPPAAATPVPTTPVAAGSSSRGGRGRLRWLLVGLVALGVAGTAGGATLLLTSDTAAPAVLTYAPADSVAYTELRLDLPGSQQAELAKVMSAFPGFDDQAAFPAKLNEALDQLVGKASDGKQSWTTDIDPWFGRQLSISVGPLPTSAEAGKARRGLLLASVTDVAKAQAWATKLTADHGATTSTETYNGVTITTVTSSDASMV